jgi:hypothetical protein
VVKFHSLFRSNVFNSWKCYLLTVHLQFWHLFWLTDCLIWLFFLLSFVGSRRLSEYWGYQVPRVLAVGVAALCCLHTEKLHHDCTSFVRSEGCFQLLFSVYCQLLFVCCHLLYVFAASFSLCAVGLSKGLLPLIFFVYRQLLWGAIAL